MAKKLLALVIVVALVAGGAAVALGVGPLGDAPQSGAESGDDVESFPTETAESTNDGGDTSSTTTAEQPFTLTVDSIEECGETCRDVTTTLTNEQSSTASNVTVYTRIYAGNGTDGDVVWEGTESVGAMDAGESGTDTTRVELSLRDGYAIQSADGWITVQTTVQSENETMTTTEQRQVA